MGLAFSYERGTPVHEPHNLPRYTRTPLRVTPLSPFVHSVQGPDGAGVES